MGRETLAGDTYLKLRGRIFYFERRVPAHLVATIGKSHIRESLKTADKREARQLLNLRAAEIEQQFIEAERHSRVATKVPLRRLEELSDGQMEMLVFEWSRHEADIARANFFDQDEHGYDPSDTDIASPQQALAELRAELLLIEEAADRQGATSLSDLMIVACRFAGIETHARREGPLRRSVVEVVADQRGNKLRKFRELVRRAWCERLRLEISLLEGARHKPEYPEMVNASNNGNVPENSQQKITLGQLIDRFKESPKHSKRKKTLRYKYDYLFRLLSEVIGNDKPVSQITRSDCRAVYDLLRKLPANAKKKYPSLTLAEIVDQVAKLPEDKRPSLMNGKTLSSHVYRMSTFFKYAEVEEYIVKNPARAFDLEENKHSKDDKSPFSEAQLKEIFTASLFTGKSDQKTGAIADYSSQQTKTRYWVTIIALFHGMRLNEICQLRHDEVGAEDGISYFRLQSVHDDQTLKSASSARIVPFHPILSELGFQRYVKSIRQSNEVRLFPDLKLDGRGYYSRTIGRWFNEQFLTNLDIKSKKHSFHSFRHNFKDATRHSHIPTAIAEAICGRDEGGVGANYGAGYSLSILNSELSKVSYNSVNLKPLPQFSVR